MSIEEEILVCAVRYALGRMTYIVSDVCRYVKSKKDSLSEHCRSIIIRDIEEAIGRYNDLGRTCGMECDEKEWRELLEALKSK